MKTPEERAKSIWAPIGSHEIAKQIREAVADEREEIATHIAQAASRCPEPIASELSMMATWIRKRS